MKLIRVDFLKISAL